MGTHVSFGGYNLGAQIGVNNAPVTNNFQIPSDLAGKLPMVHEATFNSFEDQHEDDCLPGTRIDVLHQIEDWAFSHTSSVGEKCIFWLNGMAGTGKSTISRTIATRFSQASSLGASFFFKRGEGDRGNATKLISTLARQLATTISDLRPYIEQAVRDDPDIATKEMGKQFKALIMTPLLALSSKPNPSATPTSVVVIDALDECERDEDIRLILRLLPELQQSKFIRMRVFLTSRPELEIRLGFSKFSDHKDFILHEIPQEVVDHDLSLFLNHRLSQIRTERSLQTDWPGESTIHSLVILSSPLFIFAATICRMFEDRAFDPVETLDEILASSDNISKLDRTYLPVLKRFLKESQDKRHQEQLIQGFKQVIGAIVMLESPLSVHSLSKFLNITENSIQARLDLLHSVLSVPKSNDLPVRLFHLSFRDFLLDPETLDKTPLWIDAKEMHNTMTLRCLQICRNTLRKNICQLPSEGTRRATLSRESLDHHLPPDVSYACRYWGHHFVQFMEEYGSKGNAESLLQNAFSFLKMHFLHWFEAMGLLGLMPELLGILDGISNVLSKSQDDHESEFLKFLVYARLFALKYSQIADEAPLQLYCAGLIFSPQNGIRKGFEGDLPKWINQLPLVDSNWSQEINTFEGHEDPVFKLVFSPDGRLLASISAHSIRLWDLTIGTLRNSFQADILFEYDNHRELVAFSPNSRLLAAVPYTGPIKMWSVVTGVPQDNSLNELKDIQNMRFSPDSRMLASVFNSGKMILYGLEKGISERALQSRSHEAAIRIFSCGLVLASGFRDGQIEIVDLMKGITKPMIKGHSKSIDGLAFSPDGLLLASMSKSDGLIRLWNVRIGTPISDISSPLEPPSPRMIFSPDNGTFVFVTPTGIQLRDPTTGGLRLLLDAGFTDMLAEAFKVREIAFSGSGSMLVFVGSGGRISLWDCATGTRTRTYRRHAGLITSATLAPNNQGLLMASGSENGTVRLLDLTTTQAMNVDAVEIKEMIFSHEGRLLVSRSPREVHIWDTLSGTKKNTLPHDFDYDAKGRIRSKQKERGDIIAMAFNHDSTLLALTDGGEMEILLWSVSRGAPKKTILSAAGAGILWAGNGNFLAFSPSGLLASSYGRVVVLWDPVTGARLHQWVVEETLSRLEFIQHGLSLGTGDGESVLNRDAFSENSRRVNLRVVFSVLRVQGMLRSIGIERGLREISGLKKGKERSSTTRIVMLDERKQGGSACIDDCELESPQLYIEGKQWIVLNGKRAVWLPLEFRPELGGQYKTMVDESGGKLALGSMSGQVYFIGFDTSSCT